MQILFDGPGMEVKVMEGLLSEGVHVDKARVSIDQYRDAIVSVTGSARASAHSAAMFGLATPMAGKVLPYLKDRAFQGNTKTDVSLKIPLKQIAATEYLGESQLTDLRVDSSDGLPPVSKTNGVILFNQGGIQVDGLEGRVFDSPFRLSALSSPQRPTEIELEGRLSDQTIRKLVDHPLTNKLSGSTHPIRRSLVLNEVQCR